MFKIGENKYTQVSYYLSLLSMFIKYSKESIVKSSRNKIEIRTYNSNNAVERELDNTLLFKKAIQLLVISTKYLLL